MAKDKKKITFITVARSDFGIMKNIIKKSTENKNIETSLFITGSHLSKKFGYSIREIKKESFVKNLSFIKTVKINYTNSKKNMTNNFFAKIIAEANNFFKTYRPDKVVLIGDRYEMLAAAIASYNLNIEIIHFCGGSRTLGSLDDKYRDMISILSNKHFVETKKHKKNLLKLKINQKDIFITGAPALENVNKIRFMKKNKLLKKYKIKIEKKNKILLITFHPETKISNKKNIKNLMMLIKFLNEVNEIAVFTYPGADFGYNAIIKKIEKIKNNKIFKFKNLGIKEYYQFLKNADAVIGNSSSGIIETGFFKVPTIDIGDRQKMRVRNTNVLSSKFNLKNLKKSYKKITSKNFLLELKKINDIYKLKMNSSQIIKKII